MDESTLALDADALSAWMRQEITVPGALGGPVPALPAPVVHEACHGWILAIGKADQRRREDLAALYLDRLADLIEFVRSVIILRYTPDAQALFPSLRARCGSRGANDLRIAAIC